MRRITICLHRDRVSSWLRAASGLAWIVQGVDERAEVNRYHAGGSEIDEGAERLIGIHVKAPLVASAVNWRDGEEQSFGVGKEPLVVRM